MILDGHYAVVWRVANSDLEQRQICTAVQWVELNRTAAMGHVVILECWDICSGKCIASKEELIASL